VGVDFRGLGGTNNGPLAVLDDITSGFDDNASAALDNSGAGLDAGGSATAPSSGFFFNDGSDGDFRGRTENIFTNPLGQVLSALGGGTFQVTYLDDFSLSAIIRATEKTAQMREMTAPAVTVFNTQRANLSSVTQISYVQDFDVEVAQTSFIADPVIGVIQEGVVLDVRPTVSNDRQYITLEHPGHPHLPAVPEPGDVPAAGARHPPGGVDGPHSGRRLDPAGRPQGDQHRGQEVHDAGAGQHPDPRAPLQAAGQVGRVGAPDDRRDGDDHGSVGRSRPALREIDGAPAASLTPHGALNFATPSWKARAATAR
jgi:hypothetical protein